jgi:hypothetical protein
MTLGPGISSRSTVTACPEKGKILHLGNCILIRIASSIWECLA